MRLSNLVILCLVAAFVLLSVPFSANGADQTDKLIGILVKKGIITKDEAALLEKEAKDEQAKEEAAAKGDWTKKMEAGYDKGAFIRTKDKRFSLKMNAGIQGQFNYQFLDDRKDKTTFQVRRARLYTTGNAFYPWLKYYFQLTLENSVNMRDGYMEADYYKGFVPRLGQYKVPFDREWLTSAFQLQLIERSIAANEFRLDRDIGLQIGGFPIGDLFEYRLGIFNGSGANQDNVNDKYMYVGRAVLTPFGPYPYSQAALDAPAKPRLAIGVAGAWMPGLAAGERKSLAGNLGNLKVMPVRSDVYEYTGDLAFKLCGFSFEGGYYYRTIDPQQPTPHGRTNAWGYWTQAGYFLIPKHFEVAGRYSYINPDNPVQRSNNNQHEATGGITYYFEGHPLKVQLNYSFFRTQANPDDRDDHVVRTQATLYF